MPGVSSVASSNKLNVWVCTLIQKKLMHPCQCSRKKSAEGYGGRLRHGMCLSVLPLGGRPVSLSTIQIYPKIGPISVYISIALLKLLNYHPTVSTRCPITSIVGKSVFNYAYFFLITFITFDDHEGRNAKSHFFFSFFLNISEACQYAHHMMDKVFRQARWRWSERDSKDDVPQYEQVVTLDSTIRVS